MSSGVQAQELLYPAKYHVYKVVLSRFISFDAGYQALKSWKVDLLMVTGRSNVLMYNTAGNGVYRTAVGAPTYRLGHLKHAYRNSYDGVVTEGYHDALYLGQISPPSEEVPDPSEPDVVWRSTVSGNKSLNLHWMTLRTQFKLTFYCRPL